MLVRDGGGTSTKKATPTQTAQFTKAQVEKNERAAAAAKPTSSNNILNTLTGSKPLAPNSVGPLASGYVPIPKATQSLTVPSTATAPNFTRTTATVTTVKPPPKPAPKTVTPPKPIPKPPKPPSGSSSTVVDTQPDPDNTYRAVYPTPQSVDDSSDSAIEELLDPPVKSAPIDTVVFIDETLSAEFMVDLLFESIGGQELLSIARNDTVNGQEVIYQPIKNLGILRDAYSPNNLLRLQETSDRFFANFIINFAEKIPKVGSGENGANYYLDLSTGNGVIELINLRSDELVELQIVTAGIIEDVGI